MNGFNTWPSLSIFWKFNFVEFIYFDENYEKKTCGHISLISRSFNIFRKSCDDNWPILDGITTLPPPPDNSGSAPSPFSRDFVQRRHEIQCLCNALQRKGHEDLSLGDIVDIYPRVEVFIISSGGSGPHQSNFFHFHAVLFKNYAK